jgi:hypothetical protein
MIIIAKSINDSPNVKYLKGLLKKYFKLEGLSESLKRFQDEDGNMHNVNVDIFDNWITVDIDDSTDGSKLLYNCIKNDNGVYIVREENFVNCKFDKSNSLDTIKANIPFSYQKTKLEIMDDRILNINVSEYESRVGGIDKSVISNLHTFSALIMGKIISYEKNIIEVGGVDFNNIKKYYAGVNKKIKSIVRISSEVLQKHLGKNVFCVIFEDKKVSLACNLDNKNSAYVFADVIRKNKNKLHFDVKVVDLSSKIRELIFGFSEVEIVGYSYDDMNLLSLMDNVFNNRL